MRKTKASKDRDKVRRAKIHGRRWSCRPVLPRGHTACDRLRCRPSSTSRPCSNCGDRPAGVIRRLLIGQARQGGPHSPSSDLAAVGPPGISSAGISSPRSIDMRSIEPHVTVFDKSTRQDGTFSRDDFTYDHVGDVYSCPAGKTLTTTGSRERRSDITLPREQA